MASVSWSGFDSLRSAVEKIGDPPMAPLMERWEQIIVEGNRRGALQGIDGFDQPMTPLKYRAGQGIRARNRKGNFGTTRYRPKVSTGANLTTREYQQLDGPRLAPRYEHSRIIANLHTGHGRDPSNNYTWFAEGAWLDVVDRQGRSFLMAHFEPLPGSRIPRYDMRPIRPADMRLASDALRDYAEELLRIIFLG